MVDDRDPAAHWAMGRALWLRGRQDQSIVELERAIDLSPNFALGHYTLAFVHSQSGDPAGRDQVLRPLTPAQPVRSDAVRHAGRPRDGPGAPGAVRRGGRLGASRPPPAPTRMRTSWRIAAYCLALAGRLDEARAHLAAIRKTLPGYRIDDFLTAMQFAPDGAALFRQGAKRAGIE